MITAKLWCGALRGSISNGDRKGWADGGVHGRIEEGCDGIKIPTRRRGTLQKPTSNVGEVKWVLLLRLLTHGRGEVEGVDTSGTRHFFDIGIH